MVPRFVASSQRADRDSPTRTRSMTSLGESGFGRGEYGSDTGAYDGVGLSSRGFVGCSASNRSGDDSSPGNEGVGADDIPWSGEERRDGVRLSSSGFAGSSSGAARPIDQAMINDGVGADDIPWSDEEHRDGVRLSSSGFAGSSEGAARPLCQPRCLTGIRPVTPCRGGHFSVELALSSVIDELERPFSSRESRIFDGNCGLNRPEIATGDFLIAPQ